MREGTASRAVCMSVSMRTTCKASSDTDVRLSIRCVSICPLRVWICLAWAAEMPCTVRRLSCDWLSCASFCDNSLLSAPICSSMEVSCADSAAYSASSRPISSDTRSRCRAASTTSGGTASISAWSACCSRSSLSPISLSSPSTRGPSPSLRPRKAFCSSMTRESRSPHSCEATICWVSRVTRLACSCRWEVSSWCSSCLTLSCCCSRSRSGWDEAVLSLKRFVHCEASAVASTPRSLARAFSSCCRVPVWRTTSIFFSRSRASSSTVLSSNCFFRFVAAL
mmetsp:Transcript_33512/g.96813  ORF Transcript_33512/g.96813 Transcript_33512/m.96813 type:complete len:281 (-) Transcript_33512:151-993(-)